MTGLCAGGFALGAAGASALWNGEAGKGLFGAIHNGSFGLEIEKDSVTGAPTSLEVPANAAEAGEIAFDAEITLRGNTLAARLRLGKSDGFDDALELESWGYDCGGGVQQAGIDIDDTSDRLTPVAGQETRSCTVKVQTSWTEELTRLSTLNGTALKEADWPFVLTMEQVR